MSENFQELTEKNSRTKSELRDLIDQIHQGGLLNNKYITPKSQFSVYTEASMKGKKKAILPKGSSVKVLDSKVHNGNLRLNVEFTKKDGTSDTGYIYVVFKGGETTFKIDTNKSIPVENQDTIDSLRNRIQELSDEISRNLLEIGNKDQKIKTLETEMHGLKEKIKILESSNGSNQSETQDLKLKLEKLSIFVRVIKEVGEKIKSNTPTEQIIEWVKRTQQDLDSEHKVIIIQILQAIGEKEKKSPTFETQIIDGVTYVKINGDWKILGTESIDIEKIKLQSNYKKLGYEYIKKLSSTYHLVKKENNFYLFRDGASTHLINSASEIQPEKLLENLYIIQTGEIYKIIDVSTGDIISFEGEQKEFREKPRYIDGGIGIGEKKYDPQAKKEIKATPVETSEKGNICYAIIDENTIGCNDKTYSVIKNHNIVNIMMGYNPTTKELFLGKTDTREISSEYTSSIVVDTETHIGFKITKGNISLYILFDKGGNPVKIDGKDVIFDTIEKKGETIYVKKGEKTYGLDERNGMLVEQQEKTDLGPITTPESKILKVGESIPGQDGFTVLEIQGGLIIGEKAGVYIGFEKKDGKYIPLQGTMLNENFQEIQEGGKRYIFDKGQKKLFEITGEKQTKDTSKTYYILKKGDDIQILSKTANIIIIETENSKQSKILPNGVKIIVTNESSVGGIVIIQNGKLIDIIEYTKSQTKIGDAHIILTSIDGRKAIANITSYEEVKKKTLENMFQEIGESAITVEQIGNTSFYKISAGESIYIFNTDAKVQDIIKYGTSTKINSSQIQGNEIHIQGKKYSLDGKEIVSAQTLSMKDGKIITSDTQEIDWSKIKDKKDIFGSHYLINLDGKKYIVKKVGGEILSSEKGVYKISGKEFIVDPQNNLILIAVNQAVQGYRIGITQTGYILVGTDGKILKSSEVIDTTPIGTKKYVFKIDNKEISVYAKADTITKFE